MFAWKPILLISLPYLRLMLDDFVINSFCLDSIGTHNWVCTRVLKRKCKHFRRHENRSTTKRYSGHLCLLPFLMHWEMLQKAKFFSFLSSIPPQRSRLNRNEFNWTVRIEYSILFQLKRSIRKWLIHLMAGFSSVGVHLAVHRHLLNGIVLLGSMCQLLAHAWENVHVISQRITDYYTRAYRHCCTCNSIRRRIHNAMETCAEIFNSQTEKP